MRWIPLSFCCLGGFLCLILISCKKSSTLTPSVRLSKQTKYNYKELLEYKRTYTYQGNKITHEVDSSSSNGYTINSITQLDYTYSENNDTVSIIYYYDHDCDTLIIYKCIFIYDHGKIQTVEEYVVSDDVYYKSQKIVFSYQNNLLIDYNFFTGISNEWILTSKAIYSYGTSSDTILLYSYQFDWMLQAKYILRFNDENIISDYSYYKRNSDTLFEFSKSYYHYSSENALEKLETFVYNYSINEWVVLATTSYSYDFGVVINEKTSSSFIGIPYQITNQYEEGSGNFRTFNYPTLNLFNLPETPKSFHSPFSDPYLHNDSLTLIYRPGADGLSLKKRL